LDGLRAILADYAVVEAIRHETTDKKTKKKIRKATKKLVKLLTGQSFELDENPPEETAIFADKSLEAVEVSDAGASKMPEVISIIPKSFDQEVEIEDAVNNPQSLEPFAKRWLEKMFDAEDVERFTTDDIDRLVNKIATEIKPITEKRQNSPNYREIITARLRGKGNAEVAADLGVNATAITSTLSAIAKKVTFRHDSEDIDEPDKEADTVSPSVGFIPEKLGVAQQRRVPTPADVYTPVQKEAKKPPVEELDSILSKAIERPSDISPEQWRDVACTRIANAAEKQRFTYDEVSDLLGRLGLGDYITADTTGVGNRNSTALDKLGKLYHERSRERLMQKGMAIENVSVRALVTFVPGSERSYRTAIQAARRFGGLSKTYPDVRPENMILQRHCIRGVVEILKSDEWN